MNTTCHVLRRVGKCQRGRLRSAVRVQAMDRLKKGLVILNRPPADDPKLRRNRACSLCQATSYRHSATPVGKQSP